MTPVLYGRWQSRIFLLATVGVFISWLLSVVLSIDLRSLLTVLAYVLLLGILWDVLYTLLQAFRWDRDWPPAFAVFAGIVEAVALWLLLNTGILPGVASSPPLGVFALHYSSVWLATFIILLGPIRILFANWRWYGGRIV
jgi:hypothetical protein